MENKGKKIKVAVVAGARPNFMKVAPIIDEMKRCPGAFEILFVHTGQHYDEKMSKLFFEDLGMPEPDVYLGVGSGTHAEQTARIMERFEKVLFKENPDLVMVVGDVNSTFACALCAAKLNIRVAHVEAGLRSFDRAMPEEINRVLTDAISDYLFITEESARENLLREGKSESQIYFVGNVMIDTLLKNKEKAEKSGILKELGLNPKSYALVTLHRPSNVDDPRKFQGILGALAEISKRIKVVFPVHPRTQKAIEKLVPKGEGRRTKDEHRIAKSEDPRAKSRGIRFIEPLGYLDFLKLMSEAKLVLTDSGGMQEETTILNVPCLTLRENTERPVTVEVGTNVLVGNSPEKIILEAENIFKGVFKQKEKPPLWSGGTAHRIVQELLVAQS